MWLSASPSFPIRDFTTSYFRQTHAHTHNRIPASVCVCAFTFSVYFYFMEISHHLLAASANWPSCALCSVFPAHFPAFLFFATCFACLVLIFMLQLYNCLLRKFAQKCEKNDLQKVTTWKTFSISCSALILMPIRVIVSISEGFSKVYNNFTI